jgi:hypothetical protein
MIFGLYIEGKVDLLPSILEKIEKDFEGDHIEFFEAEDIYYIDGYESAYIGKDMDYLRENENKTIKELKLELFEKLKSYLNEDALKFDRLDFWNDIIDD